MRRAGQHTTIEGMIVEGLLTQFLGLAQPRRVSYIIDTNLSLW